MPELPEVETVRRGLAPFLQGARVEAVRLNRPNLRFPFPAGFSDRLAGQRIETLGRRAKYLLFILSDGAVWLSHLGMTGSFAVKDRALSEPSRRYPPADGPKHIHMEADIVHPDHGPLTLTYADPRRFGFMDLFGPADPNPFIDGLGPEPLGNQLDAPGLGARLRGKKGPIKTVLLDQRVIAGLGNIYVCEALYQAGILPTRAAGRLTATEIDRLVMAIRTVLEAALEAGGSTLQDFRNAQGQPGYFQHSFSVYDREGEACRSPGCGGRVARLVQAGRSSFFCPACQR